MKGLPAHVKGVFLRIFPQVFQKSAFRCVYYAPKAWKKEKIPCSGDMRFVQICCWDRNVGPRNYRSGNPKTIFISARNQTSSTAILDESLWAAISWTGSHVRQLVEWATTTVDPQFRHWDPRRQVQEGKICMFRVEIQTVSGLLSAPHIIFNHRHHSPSKRSERAKTQVPATWFLLLFHALGA